MQERYWRICHSRSMPGVFPTWILTLTALYRFSRIRPWTYLLIFSFLFIRTIPLLSSSPPNSFYFITRLIDIAASASRRLYFIVPCYFVLSVCCAFFNRLDHYSHSVSQNLQLFEAYSKQKLIVSLSEASNKIVIFGNASVANVRNKSRVSLYQTILNQQVNFLRGFDNQCVT